MPVPAPKAWGCNAAQNKRATKGARLAGARAAYGLEWKFGWTEYSVTVDANTSEIAGCEQDWC